MNKNTGENEGVSKQILSLSQLAAEMLNSFVPCEMQDTNAEMLTSEEIHTMMIDTIDMSVTDISYILKEKGCKIILDGDRFKWLLKRK
jgi:hypothetical protein